MTVSEQQQQKKTLSNCRNVPGCRNVPVTAMSQLTSAQAAVRQGAASLVLPKVDISAAFLGANGKK